MDIVKEQKRSFFKVHFTGWQNILVEGLLFSAFFIIMELFFHITEEMVVDARIIYPILFSFPVGFFFTAIVSLMPYKANCIVSTVIAALTGIWLGTQMCYAGVFQTYMPLREITMAGDVANGFGDEIKAAVIDSLPKIIAIILVVIVFSLTLFIYLRPKRKSPVLCLASLVLCLILHLGCRGALLLGGEGAYAPKNMYTQVPRVLDNNVENFGVITSLRLEFCDLFAGNDGEAAPSVDTEKIDLDNLGTTVPIPVPPSVTTDGSGDEPEIPPTPVKIKNVIDIDYESIIANEKNKSLLSIHNYVNSQNGSYVNQYTGMFKGYNLIMICAESFTSHLIDPELTPTLYKMSTNGFVFNNFYGMMKSITTNGEYAFCTGLIPTSQGNVDDLKKNSTFLLSSDKYMPYCMGNVFNSFGASTFAYHSNTGRYYNRKLTHPNMGYEVCRFMEGAYVNGVLDESRKLVFSTGRSVPNSDFECAEQTLDDYLSIKNEDGTVKQFTAYYMTYSGHHPYYALGDTEHINNPMAKYNRDKVDNLPYSEKLKTYIACNLQVELMVTEMIERLTEAGCLENTVIVLTSDHYPYGLLDNDYRALAGKYVDPTFGIFKNSFICYNAGMETPVEVNTPCCTVDIVPTLLNLFGYDYDSRLLSGTDILDPNSFHIAMLYNQNFITDKVMYDTKKGKVTYLVDKSEVPDGYVESCITRVKNKFTMGVQMVKNDYFKVFYDNLEAQNAE